MRKRLACVALLLAVFGAGCIPAPTVSETNAAYAAMKQAGLNPVLCSSSRGGTIYLKCSTKRAGTYSAFKIERYQSGGSTVRLRHLNTTVNKYDYFTYSINSKGILTGWRNNPL